MRHWRLPGCCEARGAAMPRWIPRTGKVDTVAALGWRAALGWTAAGGLDEHKTTTQSSRAFVCSYSDRVRDPSHCIPRVFVPTPIVAMLLCDTLASVAKKTCPTSGRAACGRGAGRPIARCGKSRKCVIFKRTRTLSNTDGDEFERRQ